MPLIHSSSPIEVSSLEEYNQIKHKYFRRQYFKFICCNCNKLEIVRKDSKSLELFECKSCLLKTIYNSENYKNNRKQKSIEKYGSYEAFLEFQHQQIKNAIINKYGVENVFQADEIKEKIKKASLEKFGTTAPGASSEAREKQKETMLKKYGVEVSSQSEILRKKGNQTKLKKYGDENYNNRQKFKLTCLEKYGVDNSFKCPAVRLKWQNNMLEKYGTTHPYFGHYFYKYDNIVFDSSWELIYYAWLKLNNKDFEYHTKRIPYIINGVEHYYEPDFIVDNCLVEIKGPQFFDKNQHLFNPWTGEVLLEKEQCMKDNNVVIISDISEYKTYVLGFLGQDFINVCKLDR